jgi:hypothetical protein
MVLKDVDFYWISKIQTYLSNKNAHKKKKHVILGLSNFSFKNLDILEYNQVTFIFFEIDIKFCVI